MPEPAPAARLTLWRAYVPRWAHLPLSGEGAARFGGRWNPVGQSTTYAACELSTAWAEYNQGFVQHPAIIARFDLEDAVLADLTDEHRLSQFGVSPDIHRCDWRAAMDRGEIPETHLLQAKMLGDGFHGLIYPSVMSPGGRCVALWCWNEKDGPTLSVIDPENRLPSTQASWL